MKAIIIAAGNPPSKKLIHQEITAKTIIIAVDGGANCLWQYNIIPHYLIGDLDSINNKILNELVKKNINILRYPSDKNHTDTDLALQTISNLKVSQAIFLGCLGGQRTDHLIACINLLIKSHKLNIIAAII